MKDYTILCISPRCGMEYVVHELHVAERTARRHEIMYGHRVEILHPIRDEQLAIGAALILIVLLCTSAALGLIEHLSRWLGRVL